jgi:hypothetical protein
MWWFEYAMDVIRGGRVLRAIRDSIMIDELEFANQSLCVNWEMGRGIPGFANRQSARSRAPVRC